LSVNSPNFRALASRANSKKERLYGDIRHV
jgi:hypothetical protein